MIAVKFNFSPVVLSPSVQMALSTAEDSANYFTGQESHVGSVDKGGSLPSGIYRIVDDQLFQIIEAPRPQRNVLPRDLA